MPEICLKDLNVEESLLLIRELVATMVENISVLLI